VNWRARTAAGADLSFWGERDDFDNLQTRVSSLIMKNVRRQVDADIKSAGAIDLSAVSEAVCRQTWRRNGPAAIAVYAIGLATLTEQSIWHACESATCARMI